MLPSHLALLDPKVRHYIVTKDSYQHSGAQAEARTSSLEKWAFPAAHHLSASSLINMASLGGEVAPA